MYDFKIRKITFLQCPTSGLTCSSKCPQLERKSYKLNGLGIDATLIHQTREIVSAGFSSTENFVEKNEAQPSIYFWLHFL